MSAVEPAESARREMSEVLHMVMHELRSPLTIIGGYISMIRDGAFGPPPDAWQRPLDTVSAKIGEAQQLVDELVLAARLEEGTMPARDEAIDLATSAERAVERAQPRASLLGASVESSVDREVAGRGDLANVDRILDNLINNALAYGGSPPRVRVSSGDGSQLVVEDNGDGVDASDREHIFERFYRGRRPGAGTGLGLYISRRLAEASGGSLELEDTPAGRGSRFVLRLRSA